MKTVLKKIIVVIITLEARMVLWRYKPQIAAVTGSVGKTSTKDAVAAVLAGEFKIRKSQKSFNSEIGVPLVVLGCENAWLNPFLWLWNIFRGLVLMFWAPNYPKWLVLETGVDRPGDMKKMSSWLKPHIVVFTALSDIPTHVEFFASPKAVAKEKSEILKKLEVDDFFVLNSDDDTVYDLKEKTKAKILTYGFGEGADLVASNYKIMADQHGINFKVDCEGTSIPVRLFNVFGKHHVYPALAALAVGRAVGLNFVDMGNSLNSYESPPGRFKPIEGVKNSLILDDSYNSSPLALAAALETMGEMEAKRKIAVLGDMLELGKYAIEAHKSMAEFIIKAGVSIVFAVGPRAKFIAEGLRELNFPVENIFEFSTSQEAGIKAQDIIEEGDLVLIKGSQSMRMEKIVEEIMAHPENKEKLLARQEKAWKNR